jgi:hypothetical protein
LHVHLRAAEPASSHRPPGHPGGPEAKVTYAVRARSGPCALGAPRPSP